MTIVLGGIGRYLAPLSRIAVVGLALIASFSVPSSSYAGSQQIGRADVHLLMGQSTGELEINASITQTQNACEVPLNGKICLRYSVTLDDQPLYAGFGLIAPTDVKTTGSSVTLTTNTANYPAFTLLAGAAASLSISWEAIPGSSPVVAGNQTSTLSPATITGTVAGYSLTATGGYLTGSLLIYAG